MNQSCCSLGFLSQNSLWISSTHFVGIKVFIAGYEMECKKSLFNKTTCTGESLATGMSREFQSLVTKLGQTLLFVLQWSSWPDSSSSYMLHTCASFWQVTPRESSRESPFCCTLLIKSSHSLTQNPYIISTQIQGF